ncbi:hypothetical protein [Sinorhizobium meliloti]|uniref:hypothetical protein n=1 Tax=Rhizobium meliloti TaxID=382 RepID=UPI000FD5053B|nr:hypothetical protein [Sinorhizobium meliloti]RVN85969.1 hypothetical protein CN101_21825 [Sinorhizobium meliloti]RVO58275.1 hypothetical protein CN094_20300 [Sinorhizobium meliloti]
MSSNYPAYVLGYHGCYKAVGMAALTGASPLLPSEKAYDWLGSGIYFWENDPERALEWVLGAIIDLGNCLDLITRKYVPLIQTSYRMLKSQIEATGGKMPVNSDAKGDKNSDKLVRKLDCAVINYVHEIAKEAALPAFDTVRGLFPEGNEIYDGARFHERTHTQIAVRNDACIKGFFLPRGETPALTSPVSP